VLDLKILERRLDDLTKRFENVERYLNGLITLLEKQVSLFEGMLLAQGKVEDVSYVA